MKRIITLIIVFTIALASVCWADGITGTWELDHKGMTSPSADPAELEEANKALNEMDSTPTYITARSDGAMVYTFIMENFTDCRIGEWYKYAPNKYVFMYSFSTLTGTEDQKIYYMEINDGVLEFTISQEKDAKVIYYLNKVEEE